MAELVGVVASSAGIASLAVQIADNLIKLKAFWDEVKDAPETISDLLAHIEELNYLMVEMEESSTDFPELSHLMGSRNRSLITCRRVMESLKKLVDDLGADIDNQKRVRKAWMATKVVLKKDKIARYKERLERAVDLLVVSSQIYTKYQPANICVYEILLMNYKAHYCNLSPS